ncbi:hypothetical protein L1987_68789 [Smallanthus sonchifolius]|uniref:Uncharacterized protein n=1 Tax=Smallanthus sonchifolius TaxID=185202 RepID=A0ACB9B6P4_9ASTR|nr:hypothetical protein L1987_68789 [Smallanthus sonchifolius]
MLKEVAKDYIRSCLLEAKWLKEGYMPTVEEYVSNAWVTVAQALMIARSYVGMGDLVTELIDDIATHREEQERDHIPSCIECYIKETGALEEEACEFFSKQVEDAWKVINQESLRPTKVPFPLVMPTINLTRVGHVIYGDNDLLMLGKKWLTTSNRFLFTQLFKIIVLMTNIVAPYVCL